jgi:hypothetical protein
MTTRRGLQEHDTSPIRWLALAWGLARVPLLLVLLFALRHPVLNLIEATVDIGWITEKAIDVMSTPLTRVCLAAVVLAALLAASWAGQRIGGWKGFAVALAAGAGLILTVGLLTGSGVIWIGLLIGLLACNWIPDDALRAMGIRVRWLNLVIALTPGPGEAAFTSRYLAWMGSLVRPGQSAWPPSPWMRWGPGAVVTAVALGFLVSGARLVPMEQAARSGEAVNVVARGDFNGLALSSDGDHLFITGHGVPRLMRYDLRTRAVTLAKAETGSSQGLAYDPDRREIMLHDRQADKIIVIGADDLQLRRMLPATDLSEGDAWIVVDSHAVTVASEANSRTGWPLLVIDRDTGRLLFRRREDPGNLLAHPTLPIVYMSFFRRSSDLLSLDAETGRIAARVDAPERLDRMEFDARRNELLAASTAEGQVLRYDATTLKPKGSYRAITGVRVMAVDASRDEMLVGSIATGEVALIELASGEVVKRWYLGPWLRTIKLDTARGTAFVSANGWLYSLRYAASRPSLGAARSPSAGA